MIILDLHRFPVGFKVHEKERHKQLVDILYDEIGDIALPRIYQKKNGPTLREIWKQKRRLIVCYNNNNVALGKYNSLITSLCGRSRFPWEVDIKHLKYTECFTK